MQFLQDPSPVQSMGYLSYVPQQKGIPPFYLTVAQLGSNVAVDFDADSGAMDWQYDATTGLISPVKDTKLALSAFGHGESVDGTQLHLVASTSKMAIAWDWAVQAHDTTMYVFTDRVAPSYGIAIWKEGLVKKISPNAAMYSSAPDYLTLSLPFDTPALPINPPLVPINPVFRFTTGIIILLVILGLALALVAVKLIVNRL